MASAKTCGSSAYPQWGLSESYDRFGNRLSQSLTAGSGPTTNMSFNGNNQPVGYTYDPSGNMTVEPLSPPNDMTYDGENHMTAFQGFGNAATYSYDGNALRVIKSGTGGTTVNIFSGSSVIAEYDNGAAPASPSREYIYNPAGGATTGLLAMISGGTTTYFHQDDKSVRLTTDGNGNVLAQQGAYPFGESWYTNLGPNDNWVFTSYDRDSESGLDYALARYYDSRTGTFCSADPLAGSPDDPQSWNRYAYGRNDPIDITDPSGQHWWNWLLDAGAIAAMIWQPEIDGFLGHEWAALFGSTPADPVLVTRGAVQAATTVAYGAGDAAAASSGGWAGGLALTAATAAQATDRPKPQQGPGVPIASVNPTPCQQKVLNAVNKQFGTNGNASNISPSSDPNPTFGGGQVNVNFNFNSGLTAQQFNAIQQGRYAPSGFWGKLTGYGPSLHVVGGPSSLDPTAMKFANSNVGGKLSASFTAHLDSAWANNPIGALLHGKIDVLGHATRNPCP